MAETRKAPGWLGRQMFARPIGTNSLASGLISIVAELLRQRLTGRDAAMDMVSVARQFAVGSGLAPLATVWHTVVERSFQSWDAGSLLTVLAKTAAEQALFAPFINVSFMAALGLSEGRSPTEIRFEIRTKLADVMRGNVAFWAPAGLMMYKFVPPRFRVITSKLLSVIWMVFLISKTSKAAEKKTALDVQTPVTVPAAKVSTEQPNLSLVPGLGSLPVSEPTPVPELATPREVPDHQGDWIVNRVEGDWDGFLTEIGFNWLKRRALQGMGYGRGRVRMQVGQQSENFEIVNIALTTTTMKFRVGGGEQDATSMEGQPIVLVPRWAGDSGQVLECINRTPGGERLPLRRQYMVGDELVVELVSLSGILAKRVYQRT